MLTATISQGADFLVDPVWFRDQALRSNLPNLSAYRLAKEDPPKGLIVIELSVGTTGTVVRAEVLESSSLELGEYLRQALSEWKFTQAKYSLILPKNTKTTYPIRRGRCIFRYRALNGAVELDDIVLKEWQRLKAKRKVLEEQGIVSKAAQ